MGNQSAMGVNYQARLAGNQVRVGPGDVSMDHVPTLANEWDGIVDEADPWDSNEDLVGTFHAELRRR